MRVYQDESVAVYSLSRLSGKAVRELRSMVAGKPGSGAVVNMGVGALGSRVLCICEVIGALINPKGVKDQTPLVQVHTHLSPHAGPSYLGILQSGARILVGIVLPIGLASTLALASSGVIRVLIKARSFTTLQCLRTRRTRTSSFVLPPREGPPLAC